MLQKQPRSSRSFSAAAESWSGVVLVVVLLALWELSVVSGAVVSMNWPALSAVLHALGAGLLTGEWLGIFGSSLYRMTAGYFIGCSIGVVFGVLLAILPLARRTLTPLIELLRPVPIAALIPPLIFLLGVDDVLKISVVSLATFFPVFTSTLTGVFAVDPIHRQVARTFRVPSVCRVLQVQVPSALPYILAGMRVSLALALIVTVIAEMIAGSEGVGYFIVSMLYAVRASDMYAAVILLSILGYGLNRLFLVLEARLIPWARQRELRGGS